MRDVAFRLSWYSISRRFSLNLDATDAAVLDASGYFAQADGGFSRSPGLRKRREEEGDDGDQQNKVNEAIAEPLAVHFHGSP